MAGGNEVHNNLIFNFVRESSDHGNENSWDRVPFLTLNAFKNGTASLQPAWTSNHHNFWLLPNFGSNIDVSYSAMIESRLPLCSFTGPSLYAPPICGSTTTALRTTPTTTISWSGVAAGQSTQDRCRERWEICSC